MNHERYENNVGDCGRTQTASLFGESAVPAHVRKAPLLSYCCYVDQNSYDCQHTNAWLGRGQGLSKFYYLYQAGLYTQYYNTILYTSHSTCC